MPAKKPAKTAKTTKAKKEKKIVSDIYLDPSIMIRVGDEYYSPTMTSTEGYIDIPPVRETIYPKRHLRDAVFVIKTAKTAKSSASKAKTPAKKTVKDIKAKVKARSTKTAKTTKAKKEKKIVSDIYLDPSIMIRVGDEYYSPTMTSIEGYIDTPPVRETIYPKLHLRDAVFVIKTKETEPDKLVLFNLPNFSFPVPIIFLVPVGSVFSDARKDYLVQRSVVYDLSDYEVRLETDFSIEERAVLVFSVFENIISRFSKYLLMATGHTKTSKRLIRPFYVGDVTTLGGEGESGHQFVISVIRRRDSGALIAKYVSAIMEISHYDLLSRISWRVLREEKEYLCHIKSSWSLSSIFEESYRDFEGKIMAEMENLFKASV